MSGASAALENLSPAQRQVLLALKRRGEASVEGLAEDLRITPSGVRQHLAALRSSGLVSSRQERGRPGRPAEIYHTTELSDLFFANTSSDFAVELLGLLEEEGPEHVPRLLERRRDRRIEQLKAMLEGRSLEERVERLVRLLDEEGYLADFETDPATGFFRMTMHNCAIWAIASQYSSACTSELDLLREVLPGAAIERFSHKIAGAYVCGYEIRPGCPLEERSGAAS